MRGRGRSTRARGSSMTTRDSSEPKSEPKPAPQPAPTNPVAQSSTDAEVTLTKDTSDRTNRPDHINLVVKNNAHNEMHFRIRPDATLKKLMQEYKARKGITEDIRFYHDGVRILDDTTPDSLEMTEGDIIDVYSPQTGGC